MMNRVMNWGIVRSYRRLKGNTRISVLFEPMWGIPFNLYNFYLSLYMRSHGVTDTQIGYLISIGFISSAVFSLFAGVITDHLGRKKTTMIFDFIAWPIAIAIYAISNNFWMFALATIVNSTLRIVSVSWNLMVVEDADSEQRVAAFNLLNIISLSTGIIIPVAGLLVNALGVLKAERIFMIIAILSMSTMIVARNRFYTETKTGQKILGENKKKAKGNHGNGGFFGGAFSVLKRKPATILVIIIVVLFNIYVPIGTFTSLYFAPYMTEVLKLGASGISILGGAYSVTTLIIFVFVNPVINRYNRHMNMVIGLVIQALALILFMVIPAGKIEIAVLCIVFYATGFSIFRPLLDSLLADATDCVERARIYSLMNTLTFILASVIGAISGYLYHFNPRLIYMLSLLILICSIIILIIYMKLENREMKNYKS